MTLVLGLTGRICSGKQSLADIFEQDHQFQQKELKEFDLEFIFSELLKIKDKNEQKKFLIQQAKDVQNHVEENQKICKQAYLDWVQLDENLKMDSKPQIIYPISSISTFDYMLKRNYFYLIQLEAPLLDRYDNFKQKYVKLKDKVDLSMFSLVDDTLFYYSQIVDCCKQNKYTMQNLQSLQDLRKLTNDIDLSKSVTYRPTFDEFFMDIAFTVKQRSNCMKRAVGAVLTKNNRIIATGYNGTPNDIVNCFEGGCKRCYSNVSQGIDLQKCLCIHAEANSIMSVGIKATQGTTLYTTLFPCVFCAKIIIQAKIKKLVYSIDYDGNKSYDKILKQGDLEVIKVMPRTSYVA